MNRRMTKGQGRNTAPRLKHSRSTVRIAPTDYPSLCGRALLGRETTMSDLIGEPRARARVLTQIALLPAALAELEQRRQEEYGDDALFSVTRPRV